MLRAVPPRMEARTMPAWLSSALDYIPAWLAFQMRTSEQPGCIVAIAHRGKLVLEHALGSADLSAGEALTPRHRFRVASHSKSFTAAGILKLREEGRLKLDDPVGQFVGKLHKGVAQATVSQVLSHSAGLIRDGDDAGQFMDRRPFLSTAELMAVLAGPPTIEPGTRLKYSNIGYGLLGLVIEALTDEPYGAWIHREIVDAAGLEETRPEMPLAKGTPFARGHTGRLLLGRRLVIPGDFSTHAIGPAGGFVSTAADLVRFFGQLSPDARKSILSVASRREMVRRQWHDPYSGLETHYGLGTMSGTTEGWDWFGHSGGLQGYISQTRVIPEHDLAISVLTNAIDGWAGFWQDGVINILATFARRGAASQRVNGWGGRWWSSWGALDLVPAGDRVLIAIAAMKPFVKPAELEISGRTEGRIALASAFSSHGEPVRCLRDKKGRMTELHLGGTKLVPEEAFAAELAARYERPGETKTRKKRKR
jgi:CubicO group peptidase (beta-lactamase class C family)